ncbi:MAG: hypothetical protein LLG06_04145 [Desulfobacteraceae bacterium]|nr:hypothetical protein [Desulfobacteraceae bacterium]
MNLKSLANLTMIGYGRHTNNSLPVFTAQEVMQLSPDEMAKPHTFTTQGERDLFEYTPFGQSKLLGPHENSQETTARHRRIEHLARRLFGLKREKPDREQCALAHRVHEAFEIIEATADIVDQFINRCLEMGPAKLEKNIAYIERLAAELKAVTYEEDPAEMDVGATGEYAAHASRGIEDHLAHLWEMAHDQDLERWGPLGWKYNEDNTTCLWPIRENITDAIDIAGLAEPDKRVDWGSNIRYPGEDDGWDQEKMEADHTTPASIELIGYHPINSENSQVANDFFFSGSKAVLEIEDAFTPEQEKDWLTRQPLSFRLLIRTTRHCKDLSTFNSITAKVRETTWQTYLDEARQAGLGNRERKALVALVQGNIKPFNLKGEPNGMIRFRYRIDRQALANVLNFWFEHIPPMTKAQEGTFWTYRNITRDKLGRKPVSFAQIQPQGQKLLTRINNTETLSQLKWLAAQMIKFSKGTIRGCRMTTMEWKKVWEAYQEKKADFTASAVA